MAEQPPSGAGPPTPLADPGKQDRSARGIPVVPAFDAYRGVAVLGIVIFHILASSGLLIRAGESAPAQLVWGTLPYTVDIFFIVSGFVMFLPAAARDGRFGSVRTFAVRRAARLFPALWVALAIALALLAFLPASSLPFPGAGDIALNFTALANWATLFPGGNIPGFGVDSPVWTLTVEVAFYVVLPFVAASYFRRPLVGLAVAAAIAILWREAFEHIFDLADFLGISLSERRGIGLQFANNQFPYWAFSFGAGMTIAWAYVRLDRARDRAAVERAAPIVAGAALLVLCIFIVLAGREAIDTPPAAVVHDAWDSSFLMLGYTAALGVAMLFLAFVPGRVRTVLSNPRVRLLADISYGVYLIHAVLLWTISTQLSPPHDDFLPKDGSLRTFAIMLVLVLPLSLLYGYLSTRFVEQPIRRWAHRYGRRRQERPAADPAPAGSAGLP